MGKSMEKRVGNPLDLGQDARFVRPRDIVEHYGCSRTCAQTWIYQAAAEANAQIRVRGNYLAIRAGDLRKWLDGQRSRQHGKTKLVALPPVTPIPVSANDIHMLEARIADTVEIATAMSKG